MAASSVEMGVGILETKGRHVHKGYGEGGRIIKLDEVVLGIIRKGRV